jgi:hypothetical protein
MRLWPETPAARAARAALRWIAVLPAAWAGSLFGNVVASGLSIAVEWPFAAPRWIEWIDQLLVYLLRPAFFIAFGAYTAPRYRRAVAVALAIEHFAAFVFLVELNESARIAAFGWIRLSAVLLSCMCTVGGIFQESRERASA